MPRPNSAKSSNSELAMPDRDRRRWLCTESKARSLEYIEEQPVALATISWSPKSWLISFTYGVSPQPEQAPGEFKQRCGELAVLDVCGNVNEVLLGSNVLYAVVPVVLHFKLGFERLHFESLHALLAGTYVNAVAAAKTVEHVDSPNKAHAFECRIERGNRACFAEGAAFTSASSRTNGRIEA